jgi:hypothetical protein
VAEWSYLPKGTFVPQQHVTSTENLINVNHLSIFIITLNGQHPSRLVSIVMLMG